LSASTFYPQHVTHIPPDIFEPRHTRRSTNIILFSLFFILFSLFFSKPLFILF